MCERKGYRGMTTGDRETDLLLCGALLVFAVLMIDRLIKRLVP